MLAHLKTQKIQLNTPQNVSWTAVLSRVRADMEFVQNFTPPDFRAKSFTPSILPDFISFSKKKHNK